MQLTIKYICKKHGLTDYLVGYRKSGSRKIRCKICNIQCIRDLRRKRKKELVKIFGGKCSNCGYNKYIGALHFHHLDAKTKEHGIAKMTTSLAKMLKEANKCILLCANCHYEKEGLVE